MHLVIYLGFATKTLLFFFFYIVHVKRDCTGCEIVTNEKTGFLPMRKQRHRSAVQ